MSLLTEKIFICDACLFDYFVESMPPGWTEYQEGQITRHRCAHCNNPSPVDLPTNKHLRQKFSDPDASVL